MPDPLVFRGSKSRKKVRLALLDRDGVLNVDVGHVATESETSWMPGAASALAVLSRNGYANVVVTNQAGIAKGMYTEDEFKSFMAWYVLALRQRGGRIDAVYYCPHHPTEGHGHYRAKCSCRKPGPAMLQRAMSDFGAGAEECLMIGDKSSDIEAARAAGISNAYLFPGGDLEAFLRTSVAIPGTGRR